MSWVVDCSVVARWFLVDEATPYSDAAFARLEREVVHAPALLQAEFTNVFLKLARQRVLPPDVCEGAVERFAALELRIDRSAPAPDRLFALATQYRLSAYDACYLELALRIGAPVACMDGGLKAAATTAGLFMAFDR